MALSKTLQQTVPTPHQEYVPVPLLSTHAQQLSGCDLYLPAGGPESGEGYRLYRAADVPFTEDNRRRLLRAGSRFLYVRAQDRRAVDERGEERLDAIAGDRRSPAAVRAAAVYEVGVEVLTDVLARPPQPEDAPRLERLARSVAAVASDPGPAMEHLARVARHEFYTATHSANVAVYLTLLARAMGRTDPGELAQIAVAGLLHDVGKLAVPEETLHRRGRLSEADWALIRRHPEAGRDYIAACPDLGDGGVLAARVALEHHERDDGSGYPGGLTAAQMHPVSRLCAIVDSYDAMTAVRPYRDAALSPEEAIAALEREAPARYDARAVAALAGLVRAGADLERLSPAGECGVGLRRHPRTPLRCTGELRPADEPGPVRIRTHNISRSGLGLLSPRALRPGSRAMLVLDAPGWTDRPIGILVVRCRPSECGWYEIGAEFLAVPGQRSEPSARAA